jgi:uncharacterized protein (DUF362 family)
MEAAESPEASVHYTTLYNVTCQKIYIFNFISGTFTKHLAPFCREVMEMLTQIQLCIAASHHQMKLFKNTLKMPFIFMHQSDRHDIPP